MIAAIVVLYHPDQEAVERLLSSLIGQVNTVFAIDNTPGSTPTRLAFLDAFGEPVSYVPLGENRGIAEAQNIGIELSMKGGYSHVLLLDQDSTLSPGLSRVEKLTRRFARRSQRGSCIFERECYSGFRTKPRGSCPKMLVLL